MKLKLAAAAALLCLGQSAMAAYTVNVTEVGGNVVASGSGSINTAALPLVSSAAIPVVRGGQALLYIGGTPHAFSQMDLSPFASITGPASFGTLLVDTEPDAVSGGFVGVDGTAARLFVPHGYVSQSPMASSATWNGKTIASLGLTPGSYTWTWGAGPTADSFTLVIPAPAPASIPTLSEWALIGLSSLLAMFGIARVRRRQR